VLIDNLKDLFRQAGSRYGETARPRALLRLAEIRPIEAGGQLLHGGDLGIQTANALGRLGDPRAVPVLAGAARRAAHHVSGSEEATIHSIFQRAIARALARLTGLELGMQPGQDPEGLGRLAEAAEKWWSENERLVQTPDPAGWGPAAAGLQMRIRLDKSEYAMGEAPVVTVEIRNTTGKPIALWDHPTFFARFATDARGKAVRRMTELADRETEQPSKKDLVRIRPGKTRVIDLGAADRAILPGAHRGGWRITQVPGAAGTYSIVAHYAGVDEYDMVRLDQAWTGVLTSNRVGFTVK
jgi:hypothetical protein